MCTNDGSERLLKSVTSGNRSLLITGLMSAFYENHPDISDAQLTNGLQSISVLLKKFDFFITESCLNHIIQMLNMVWQSRPELQLRSKLLLGKLKRNKISS